MINNQKLRRTAKRIAEPIGLGKLVRQSYVDLLNVPERSYFVFNRRPSAKDAILIVGSGRGGTTWLHDVLSKIPRTQPVFEPLKPEWNAEVAKLLDYSGHMTYVRHDADLPEWHHLLHRVLTGRIRNYWTDVKRESIFPHRYIIKLVRANLMLGYIYKNFQPRIIFVMRHPCAVIESRRRVGWGADPKVIMEQTSLVDDYLTDHIDEISRAEPHSIEAHAIFWAIQNAVALQQLESMPHYLVFYERIALDPDTEYRQIAEWLGCLDVDFDRLVNYSQPSRMSKSHSINNTGKDYTLSRLESWQSKLSQRDIDVTLNWAHRFGIQHYSESLFDNEVD